MRERFHLDGLIMIALAVAVLARLLWMAWPSLLPVGSERELAEHLTFIQFIDDQGRLPTHADTTRLGTIVQMPPGFHVLASMAGRLTGTSGQRAAYPLLAFLIALTLILVYVITRGFLPDGASSPVFALVAVGLALTPSAFFFGAFLDRAFYPQAAATPLALLTWWRLAAWDRNPTSAIGLQIGILAAAVLMTWPPFWGPVALLAVVLVIVRRPLDWRDRFASAIAMCAPVIAASLLRAQFDWAWALVWDPTQIGPGAPIRELGFIVLLMGSLGVMLAARRETRTLLLFVVTIAVFAMTLLVIARSASLTPHLALRMFYLLLYPLAVAGGLGAASVAHAVARRGESSGTWRWAVAQMVVIVAIAALLFRPVAPAARVITGPLYDAAAWARTNLPTNCVEYIVAHETTRAWLHAAMLGNPPEMGDVLQAVPLPRRQPIGRWMRTDGPPYAIVELALLPAELKDELIVLAQFGDVAVLERRDGICGAVT